MDKKSIYVSIACLGFDSELMNTVSTCINNSSKDNEIIVSIACIGDFLFYENIKNEFADFNNIKINFYDLENNYGVGKGRNLAAKLYNNEDYFLQIDAHTLFLNSWDNILILSFNEAKQKNNSKLVLTAVPPKYSYMNIDYQKYLIIAHEEFQYIYCEKDKKRLDIIPVFNDHSFKELFPDKELEMLNNKFGNSLKICAAFIFGDKDFAVNRHLENHVLFWEEEVFQSIELINDDFKLIYPYIKSPICHYFLDSNSDPKSRTKISNLLSILGITKDDYFNSMKKNYTLYMNNPTNYKKIKAFEKYSGIELI
jgi:hypothetical protein